MTDVLASLMAGSATLASIFTSGSLGSGLGLGTVILGASSFTSGRLGKFCGGGDGGTLALGLGGVSGTINCVCSYLCVSTTCLTVNPKYMPRARMIPLITVLVINEAERLSGSGSKLKLMLSG